jgi:magnesium transporter
MNLPPPGDARARRHTLRGYWVLEDGTCEAVKDLTALELRGGAGRRFLWLDFRGRPDDEEERLLRTHFAWHPTIAHHFKSRSSRPRIDDYDGYTHMTLHALRSGFLPTDRRLTLELEVVLGADYLVTVHESSTPPDVDEVFQTLPDKTAGLRTPDLLLHRLVSTMVERYIPVVDAIDGRLSALEQDALYRAHPKLLEKIVVARDEVLGLKHVLAPQVQILQEISDFEYAGVRPENRAYFRNAEQRLRYLLDDIAVYQEIARNAFELYQSSITYRTNEVIRTLTVISVPLMVVAFITGLYGMNVPLPLEGHPHAFAVICTISGGIFLAMMIYFRRRHWF